MKIEVRGFIKTTEKQKYKGKPGSERTGDGLYKRIITQWREDTRCLVDGKSGSETVESNEEK